MQGTEQVINLYHIGFLVCLCLAAVFAILSVVLFFKFDIRGVFDFRTGRGKRRSIKKMEEENSRTGRLTKDPVAPDATSDLYRTPSGGMPPKIYKEDESPSQVRIRKVGTPSAERERRPEPIRAQAADEGSMETTLLAGNDGSMETTLLSEGDGSMETTLLSEDKGSAGAVQPSGGGRDAVPGSASGEPQGKGAHLNREIEYGETCLLNEVAGDTRHKAYNFVIKKECMLVHTDEEI